MPIPKGMRLAAKIVATLAGVVLALFLGWLGINLFDEDLTPAARILLTLPPNPYSPENNMYVAMAGFDAPSHQSMIEAGRHRIETYNRALDTLLVNPDAGVAFSKKSEPNKLEFQGDIKAWAPLKSSIWSSAKAHHGEVTASRTANEELYQRYLALHELHGYFETARPSHLAPVVYVPQSVRTLFLADVATRVQTGTPQQQRAALGDLQRDLLLWKTVLKGNGTLISKMLAAAGLHADMLLLADLVGDLETDPALLAGEVRPLVIPFDITDWRISDAFAAEMRTIDPVLRVIPLANSPVVGSSARPASGWGRSWNVLQVQFFKLHATENLEAEQMEHLRALADANPTQFSEARDAYREWLEHRTQIASLRTLYNPVGKILVWIGSGVGYEDYTRRIYDIAAFQRLVFLAYEIRRQAIGAKDVPKFINDHTEWATHPIDAKPFHWDPGTSTLAVITTGKQQSGRRFSITLPIR